MFLLSLSARTGRQGKKKDAEEDRGCPAFLCTPHEPSQKPAGAGEPTPTGPVAGYSLRRMLLPEKEGLPAEPYTTALG